MPLDSETLNNVIVPLVAILAIVWIYRKIRRASRSGGFRAVTGAPVEVTRAAQDITGLPPLRAFRRGASEESGWLVELEGAGMGDRTVFLLLYQVAGAGWPEIAAFRTSDKVPRLLRQANGGLYSRLEPVREEGLTGGYGQDWQLFAHPAAEPIPDLVQRLGRATAAEGMEQPLAVTLSGDHLALWCDSLGLRPMLQAGPGLREVMVGKAGS